MGTVPVNYHDRVTFAYASAACLATLTVLLPLVAFLSYRTTFGASPEAKLYVLCAFGCAGAGALLAGRRLQGLGAVSGVLGGVCGTAAFLFAAGLFEQMHQPWAPKAWLLLVFGVGVHVGVAFFWLLTRFKSHREQ